MEMVNRFRHLAIWHLASLVAGICIGNAAANPPATGSGVQSLDVFADNGRIHLLTGETPAGGGKTAKPHLFHAWSADGGATWSKPVRVDEGLPPGFALHRGMDAQIAASGNSVIAIWMTAGSDAWGGGPMASAISNDGGNTWHPGPNPADDKSTSGHGFIDIASDN